MCAHVHTPVQVHTSWTHRTPLSKPYVGPRGSQVHRGAPIHRRILNLIPGLDSDEELGLLYQHTPYLGDGLGWPRARVVCPLRPVPCVCTSAWSLALGGLGVPWGDVSQPLLSLPGLGELEERSSLGRCSSARSVVLAPAPAALWCVWGMEGREHGGSSPPSVC